MVELRPMTRAFLEAVLDGRREQAAQLLEIEMPKEFPSAGERTFLDRRLRQMLEDDRFEQWCPHAIVVEGQLIGHAGFKGPPGQNCAERSNAVEYGYKVFPAWRGRGYATEASRMLMDMAEESAGIRHFVLSVSPENEPSLAIVRKLGFVKTGEWVDREEGLQHIFELER